MPHTFDDTNIMETTVSSERVFDGLILHIDHLMNRLPDGSLAAREIARHLGAAAALPVDCQGCVRLVRQFRSPFGKVLLEIPAGKLDSSDEDHLEAARRELREETGLSARCWTHLNDLKTTVGFSDEVISIWLAEDLTQGEAAPDAGEFLNVVCLPLSEAVGMVMDNEICDAKTVSALLMAERLLRSRTR